MHHFFLSDMASAKRLNALVIGMVTHLPSQKLKGETAHRDQALIQNLRHQYRHVFSKSNNKGEHDADFHVEASMSKTGAKSLVRLMTSRHAGKVIDVICLDYVRFPRDYYHRFVSGNTKYGAQQPIVGFIKKL